MAENNSYTSMTSAEHYHDQHEIIYNAEENIDNAFENIDGIDKTRKSNASINGNRDKSDEKFHSLNRSIESIENVYELDDHIRESSSILSDIFHKIHLEDDIKNLDENFDAYENLDAHISTKFIKKALDENYYHSITSVAWDGASNDQLLESEAASLTEPLTDYRPHIFDYLNDPSNVRLKRVLDRAVVSTVAKRPSDPIYYLMHQMMMLDICDVTPPCGTSSCDVISNFKLITDCDTGESRENVSSRARDYTEAEEEQEAREWEWSRSDLTPFW